MSEFKRAGWTLIAGIPFGGLFLSAGDSFEHPGLNEAIIAVPIYTTAMFVMLVLARLPGFRVTGEIVWSVAKWGGYLFAAAGAWGVFLVLLSNGNVSREALDFLVVGLGASLGYNLARKIDSNWQAKINEWTGT